MKEKIKKYLWVIVIILIIGGCFYWIQKTGLAERNNIVKWGLLITAIFIFTLMSVEGSEDEKDILNKIRGIEPKKSFEY